MDCPVCNKVTLQVLFREGIEIDYCPKCRGVWLDRGELEKIIERNASAYAPSHPPAPEADYRREERRPERDWDDRRESRDGDARRERPSERDAYRLEHDRYRSEKPKKRGGFLGDLFEFGD